MVSEFGEEELAKLPELRIDAIDRSQKDGFPAYVKFPFKNEELVYLKGTEAMAKLAEARKLPGEGEKERTATMLAVIDTVAADLGNTRAVCRSSYIRPMFMNDWESGVFLGRWNKAKREAERERDDPRFANLLVDEVAALKYMKKHESAEFEFSKN